MKLWFLQNCCLTYLPENTSYDLKSLNKKSRFSIQDVVTKYDQIAVTEKMFNEKLHFLCSEYFEGCYEAL